MTTAAATEIIVERALYCVNCSQPTGKEYKEDDAAVRDFLCAQCSDLPGLWNGQGGTAAQGDHGLTTRYLDAHPHDVLGQAKRAARDRGHTNLRAERRMQNMIELLERLVTAPQRPGIITQTPDIPAGALRTPTEAPPLHLPGACPNCGGTRFRGEREVRGQAYGTEYYQIGVEREGDAPEDAYMWAEYDHAEWADHETDEAGDMQMGYLQCNDCGVRVDARDWGLEVDYI